jgi:hypothetical protein
MVANVLLPLMAAFDDFLQLKCIPTQETLQLTYTLPSIASRPKKLLVVMMIRSGTLEKPRVCQRAAEFKTLWSENPLKAF